MCSTISGFLALLWSLISAAYSVVLQPSQICFAPSISQCGNPAPVGSLPLQSDVLHVTIGSPSGFKLENGFIFNAGPGFPFANGNISQVDALNAFENSDCNKSLYVSGVYGNGFNAIPKKGYGIYVQYKEPGKVWYAISPTINGGTWETLGFRNYYTRNNNWHDNQWMSKCHEWVPNGGAFTEMYIVVNLTGNLDMDTCQYTSNADCKKCAWPYASVRDSFACGCIVDKNAYLSPAEIDDYPYMYCNTYSDGSGYQYYLDPSRSNFDPSKGQIVAACSNPVSGKTIYVPTQSCPIGSAIDVVFADSLYNDSIRGDSALQSAKGHNVNQSTSGSSGIGNDTATHNRLDTIIGLLRGMGGSSDTFSGTGSDTGTHNRLDSILGRLSDMSKYDSLTSYRDSANSFNLLDSASSGIRSNLDSLQSSFLRPDKPCWSCVTPPNETLQFNYNRGSLLIDTSIVVPLDLAFLADRLGFNPWALIRWLVILGVTVSTLPLFVRIASGSEDM